MFDDDALQPVRPWVWASEQGRPGQDDPPDEEGEEQSDPGGDSDVTPDPARHPEARASA